MDMVTLKNGAQVDNVKMHVVMRRLKMVESCWIGAFRELVAKCRNPAQAFTNNYDGFLHRYGRLVEADGSVSDDIRNIVLSAMGQIHGWDYLGWPAPL